MSAHSASHTSRPPRLLMAAVVLLLPGTAALVLLAGLDADLFTMAAYGLTAYAAWRAGRTWFLGAGLGALLIALSSVVVSYLQHHNINAYVSWDDPLRILGCWLWYLTIRALPQRRAPRLTHRFLAVLFAATLLFMGYLVAVTGRIPWDIACFAFLGLLLLLAAAPLLEAWLYAEAPSGRFFWIFGWLLWWFAHCPLMVDETGYGKLDLTPLITIFFLSTAFQALGILAEARRWDMGLWPFFLGVGSVLLAWAVGFVEYRALAWPVFCAWLILGSLLFLLSATGLLMNQLQSIHNQQRLIAQHNTSLNQVYQTKSISLAIIPRILQEPLDNILAHSATLQNAPALDEMHHYMLGEIHSGAERLRTVSGRIAELMALQDGTTKLSPVTIQLTSLLQQLIDSFENTCQEYGIGLDRSLDHESMTIQGDYALLLRMLHELMDNAIHACQTTGGGTVTIMATSSPAGVQLSILDTGGGLRQDHGMELSQILGRQEGFVNRLELGLSLAREIAAAHGGTLQMHSTPGKGTTATVTLPADPAREKAMRVRAQPQKSRLQTAGSIPAPSWPWRLLTGALLAPWSLVMVAGQHALLFGRLFVGGCDLLAAVYSWQAGGKWRWLAGGLFMWMAGEWWTVTAKFLEPVWQSWRAIAFQAGYICMLIMLAGIRPRQRPGFMVLAALGVLGIMEIVVVLRLLAHGGWPNLHINLALLNILIVCCASPLAQAAISGNAPTGRLLWLFGLLINIFLDNALNEGDPSHLLVFRLTYLSYGFSGLLMGIGALAEARNWAMRYSVLLLGVGGLLFTWCLGTMALRDELASFWFWVSSGALILFLGTLVVLAHHRARLASLTATLQQAGAKLEEAAATRARFLTALSHHLRTPLNAILGFADVLRDEIAGPWPQELMDPLQQIQKEAEHILVATQDLLAAEPVGR